MQMQNQTELMRALDEYRHEQRELASRHGEGVRALKFAEDTMRSFTRAIGGEDLLRVTHHQNRLQVAFSGGPSLEIKLRTSGLIDVEIAGHVSGRVEPGQLASKLQSLFERLIKVGNTSLKDSREEVVPLEFER
ncbi:hypothetical protein OV203_02505 [Nannocystis sp. ILAH1]|uniref:hypothetical protein n=1 Tax=Nannocystis sp. ILAH1 TaxID=2996789 RepID=UPI0022707107|nr:hypothetical protein [Nannocystis sp. ILAH1]MCY0985983.1 hypothetical protein [Nannocystis sp. ILAH1]